MSTAVITDAEARKNIAANVSALLKDRKMSQNELARQTKETPMLISRIIHKAHVPNVATLARVAEVLQVSVDYLLSEKPKNNRRTA